LAASEPVTWVLGILTGIASFIIMRPFLLIVILCLVAGWADYRYGTDLAKARPAGDPLAYDPTRGRLALHSKVLGLIMLALIRGLEEFLHQYASIPHGWAAGVGLVLFRQELDSLEEHRVALGAKPGLIRQILSIFEFAESRLLRIARVALLNKEGPDEQPPPAGGDAHPQERAALARKADRATEEVEQAAVNKAPRPKKPRTRREA
jgi:hypothetical protein